MGGATLGRGMNSSMGRLSECSDEGSGTSTALFGGTARARRASQGNATGGETTTASVTSTVGPEVRATPATTAGIVNDDSQTAILEAEGCLPSSVKASETTIVGARNVGLGHGETDREDATLSASDRQIGSLGVIVAELVPTSKKWGLKDWRSTLVSSDT